MSKPKILIIGGGIGGLSCATSLAETGNFDISIYESDILGGQASSKKSELCNTEISWRVFGNFYINLISIINDLDCMNNFYSWTDEARHSCVENMSGGNTNLKLIFTQDIETINKSLIIGFLSKERAINEYHNIKAGPFFNSDNMNMIIGPNAGFEPSKVTLSAFYKFIYSYKEEYIDYYKITKYPTSDSIFNPWKQYLLKKDVKIYENHKMSNISTDNNGSINSITINGEQHIADEIIFACSLDPLVNIFNNNNYLKNTIINNKLNILKTGQQFYISVNFYWKKIIIPDSKCHIFTFHDGWIPMILKRFIDTDFISDNCDKNIKEVWNISVANYLVGNYIKKYTSECSFEEIVEEIKMNLINSPHFNKLGINQDTWNDIFYTYEFDDRYYKKLPTTEKFSINEGIEENLLNNQEKELGNNIYFSAYYVKNTTGGASMETSTEIGLTTADLICKKYNINNPRKPIYRTRNYIYLIMIPFVIIDSLLYKLKLKPITDVIDPIILLIIYFVILCVLLWRILIFIIKNKKLHRYFKK